MEMDLAARYESFLNAPNIDALLPNAMQCYVTSAQTLNMAVEVAEEWLSEQGHVQFTIESTHEAASSVALETVALFDFSKWDGGRYLTSAVKIQCPFAELPVVHCVQFEQGRIASIRLFWDQASLLKQLGALERSELAAGPEQCVLIRASATPLLSQPVEIHTPSNPAGKHHRKALHVIENLPATTPRPRLRSSSIMSIDRSAKRLASDSYHVVHSDNDIGDKMVSSPLLEKENLFFVIGDY